LTATDLNEDEDLGAALSLPAFGALRRKHLDGQGLDP
jgi:hypothetical protein